MSRITLRVGLFGSTRLAISSLRRRPLLYRASQTFSSPVGVRYAHEHFVVIAFWETHLAEVALRPLKPLSLRPPGAIPHFAVFSLIPCVGIAG
jgi:hypothetical protein